MYNNNRGIAEVRQVLYRIAKKKNSCTQMISCDFFEVAKLPPDPVRHDEKPSRKGSENRIGWCRKSKGPGTTTVLSIAKRKIISRRRILGFISIRHSESLFLIVEAGYQPSSCCRFWVRGEATLYPDENQTVNQEQKEEDNLSLSPSLCFKELQESTPGWPLHGKPIRVSPEKALSKSKARELSVVEWVLSLPNRLTPSIMQSQKCMVHDENGMVNVDFNHLQQSMLGWPLLQKIASATPESMLHQEMTVTQWAMSLPDRNIVPLTPLGKETNASEVERKDTTSLSASAKLHKDLVDRLKIVPSGCRWFSYEELKRATSHFSLENLIGEGGCSSVYKGSLPCGQAVAVKISKSYKDAWNNFSKEISMTTLLNHRFIVPLIGICVEDSHLISVYNFLPEGSLEDNLHGDSWENQVLPWEVRFKVAVAVAEALNYLHQECSPPVIHRDIKSSNILLSDDFQPQISDFGLARILGPRDETEMLESDVVGTFGYIAPEYFMHGRVTDKIDIYSFGVVLLELLSGRRPIGWSRASTQASLVKWAKPLLESGELKALVDPKLGANFDSVEVERVALAAACCVNETPELRPKGSQVLRVLRGEERLEFELKEEEEETRKREEYYLVEKLPLSLPDDVDDDDDDDDFHHITTTHHYCVHKQRKRYTLQDYLRG